VHAVSNTANDRKNKLRKSVEAFPLIQTLAQAIDHFLTEDSKKTGKPYLNRTANGYFQKKLFRVKIIYNGKFNKKIKLFSTLFSKKGVIN